MSIYTSDMECRICFRDFKSTLSLARHISQKHNIPSETYYLTYIGDNKCALCSSATKFKRLGVGFSSTCGHKCGAKFFRENLKNDDIRYDKFIDKVKTNQTKIWKERYADGSIVELKEKMRESNTASHLSPQERKERYSRYYTCDEETIARLNKTGAEQCINNITTGKAGYVSMSKGKFTPKNPSKYMGDPTNIIYRSSWELHFFMYCDKHPEISGWASEEMTIPYVSPIDGRYHRYFPDVLIKKKDGKVILVEIKPYAQTQEPKRPKTQTKRYIEEVKTYVVNQAKWKAAKEHADDKGWEFVVMTERELYSK